MNILLLTESIFSETGGGQSFFQGMIRNHAHNYSCFGEPSADAPPNVRLVPLTDINRSALYNFGAEVFVRFPETAALAGKESDFLRLMDMAASVAGSEFDIVEVPDYLPFAALAPDCLRYHGVRFGKFVLSMHGCLSFALEDNWQGEATGDLQTLKTFEELSYLVADTRYGIGPGYLRHWTDQTGLPSHLLDVRAALPVRDFSQGRDYTVPFTPARRPDLCFSGRQEKWKGPELFIHLAALIPPTAFDRVRVIGPAVSILGFSSSAQISDMAARRGLAYVEDVLPRSALLREFSEQCMLLIIPSRYDTFNLVAYEAVMSGCPIVLSKQCGICEFLDTAYPGLPYLKLDLANLDASIGPITQLLESYDTQRRSIHDYLAHHQAQPWGVGIDDIYSADHTPDPEAIRRVSLLFKELIKAVDAVILPALHTNLRSALQSRITDIMHSTEHMLRPSRYIEMLDHAALVKAARRDFEAGCGDTSQLIDQLQSLVFSSDRAAAYALLADIEQARGNRVLCATYRIRQIRLTGRHLPENLALVSRVLREEGHEREAEAAELLYGGVTSQSVHDHLCTARDARHTSAAARAMNFEAVEDLRCLEHPRCTVIVPVHGAAGKVPHFIENLCCMSERSLKSVEIVLIDSALPDDTRVLLLDSLRQARITNGLSTLYVCIKQRETIPAAWNRGITLARGDYLALLGVDEMNRPDAFDIMTDYLDRHPGVDWVQGNAIVTEVNAAGGHVRDVKFNRRQPTSRHMHLLDHDYIGHVGAMYRRSIHTRYGDYDPTFRAAGGTEFKSRILSRIQLGKIDQNLGTSFQQLDAHRAQSPIAELEDLRAWYLHRSPGGLRYTFDRLAVDEAVDLFNRAMNFRRTDIEVACTDVELAVDLGDYIRNRSPQAYTQISRYVPGLKTIRHDYQQLDDISKPRGCTSILDAHTTSGMIESAAYSIAQVGRSHHHIGGNAIYDFQNDNRSQQHHTIWSGPPCRADGHDNEP